MALKYLLCKLSFKNFIFLTASGIINAFGITVFLSPVKLYDSGISGTSMLLAQISPDFLSLSFWLLVLNIPLFLYGLKKQGAVFTIYAIYTVIIYSFFAFLITDILPIDVSIASPLAGSDLLLCALFGGLISGIGSGMSIKFGGAIDGMEVLAVIFSKRIGITVGTFMMCYNLLLYICCGIVINSWILPLYSIVTYGAGLKTIDYIVEGIDRSKAALIITVEPEKVCKTLSSAFDHGMTTFNAKSYYSDSPKTAVYFIVNRFQVRKMKDIVHEIDPSAYISITEIADVYGANQG